jgi:MSHA biogenesis protein MshE
MQRPAARWRPIGTVLVESGAIDEAQLQAALAEQKITGKRLGEVLIDSGAITWNALAHAIAAQVDALDTGDAPEPSEPAAPAEPPAQPEPPARRWEAPPAPPVTVATAAPPPVSAIPEVARVDVHAGDRVETLETMLRERQRAFLELVSSTETLRRTVAKLQDQLAEKDAEIARLRLHATG